jgi:hypothetical protein
MAWMVLPSPISSAMIAAFFLIAGNNIADKKF